MMMPKLRLSSIQVLQITSPLREIGHTALGVCGGVGGGRGVKSFTGTSRSISPGFSVGYYGEAGALCLYM